MLVWTSFFQLRFPSILFPCTRVASLHPLHVGWWNFFHCILLWRDGCLAAESVQFCYPPHSPHNQLLTSSTYARRSESSFCGFIPLALSAWPQRVALSAGSHRVTLSTGSQHWAPSAGALGSALALSAWPQCWLSAHGSQRWLSVLGSQHWALRYQLDNQL